MGIDGRELSSTAHKHLGCTKDRSKLASKDDNPVDDKRLAGREIGLEYEFIETDPIDNGRPSVGLRVSFLFCIGDFL